MTDTSELDKIISDGKVDPKYSMIVFAMVLKNLTSKVDGIIETLKADDRKFATKEDMAELKKNVSSIRAGLFTVVMTIIGTILVAGINNLLKGA